MYCRTVKKNNHRIVSCWMSTSRRHRNGTFMFSVFWKPEHEKGWISKTEIQHPGALKEKGGSSVRTWALPGQWQTWVCGREREGQQPESDHDPALSLHRLSWQNIPLPFQNWKMKHIQKSEEVKFFPKSSQNHFPGQYPKYWTKYIKLVS